MEINYLTVIATITNFALLISIIIALYKVVQGIKNYINRSKEIDKKVTIILNKLDNKNDN